MSNASETILLRDPSIDWDAMRDNGCDELDFAQHRDLEKVVFYQGEEPTLFSFRRLRRSQVNWVKRGLTDVEQRERAFATGVLQVRGPLAPGRDWRPRGIDKPRFVAMSDAELDEFEWSDIQDIGSVILAASELPFGSALLCPVPPSSVSAWRAERRRRAEQSQSDAPPASSTSPEAP